jgi:hypothetical protein
MLEVLQLGLVGVYFVLDMSFDRAKFSDLGFGDEDELE